MTHDTWGQVREQIRQSVGTNNFAAWIEPLIYHSMDGALVRFEVPTSFIGNWVTQNFGDVILRHLVAAGLRAERLEFMVATQSAASKPLRPSPSASKTFAPAFGLQP